MFRVRCADEVEIVDDVVVRCRGTRRWHRLHVLIFHSLVAFLQQIVLFRCLKDNLTVIHGVVVVFSGQLWVINRELSIV